MKTQIKRFSKSTLAVVLMICMLAACVTAGIIATNAAYITGGKTEPMVANAADADSFVGAAAGDSVGAKSPESVGVTVTGTVKIAGKFDASTWQDGITMSQKDGNYFYSVSNLAYGAEFKFSYNGKEYSKASNQGSGGERTLSAYGSSSSNNKTLEEGGNTIFWKGTAGAATIWANSDLTKTWVTSGTTASETYSITYSSVANGTVTGAASAEKDTTVTVTATPELGYKCDSVTVTPASGSAFSATAGSGTNYTFTMPGGAVTVSATFSKASYSISKDTAYCSVTVADTAEFASTVNFTVSPNSEFAVKSVAVTNNASGAAVVATATGENTYSFVMPAGAVTVKVVCSSTAAKTTVYFKSATAWVYHPLITVNDGAEQEMTVDTEKYLGNTGKVHQPMSDTGSLRYAWYKIELQGVDTTKAASIVIRGQDTNMIASGTFSLTENGAVYLACDNLMDGSTLVDLTNESDAVRDFYLTPLHMVATAKEIESINGGGE